MNSKTTLIAVSAFALLALPTAFANDGSKNLKHLDNNGDGRISHEEHAESVRTKFGKLDTNNDGIVNATELAAAKEKKPSKLKFWAKNDDDLDVSELTSADQNGDGQITRSEFENASDTKFTAMDADHDGNLSEQEFGGAASHDSRSNSNGSDSNSPSTGSGQASSSPSSSSSSSTRSSTGQSQPSPTSDK